MSGDERGAYVARDEGHQQCAEECAEVMGPLSCDRLGHGCQGTGRALSEAIWEHGGSPRLREVRQSWTFVESTLALGFVAALPMATATSDSGDSSAAAGVA